MWCNGSVFHGRGGDMEEKPDGLLPAHNLVSKALKDLNVPYIQDVWAKALARRTDDPGGAITAARTLLESVCKHVLDAKQIEYKENWPLHTLYEEMAKALDIAPTQHTEPVFTQLYEACAAIVVSIGSLRNKIGDAHGKGAFAQLPDWRHAELAIHLAGAMATYLLATWPRGNCSRADRKIYPREKRFDEAPWGEPRSHTKGHTARSYQQTGC